MFAAFSVGKWVQDTCDELYAIIAKRTQQPSYYAKIGFCTDGNDQNENAIPKFFNKDCVNYGQVITAMVALQNAGAKTVGLITDAPINKKEGS